MQIMTPLEKLKSKLGGLVKLGFFGPSPGHANSSVANNATDDLEVQDMHGMTPEQQQSFALDNGGGNLKLPEYITNRYDKLPEYTPSPSLVPKFSGPGLHTPNMIDDPHGMFHAGTQQNIARGPNNRQFNPYMDMMDPRLYSTQKMNQGGNSIHAYRSNSFDTGRQGTLINRPGIRVGNNFMTGQGPRGSWSEFVPNRHALSSSDQANLNSQFMLKKDTNQRHSVSNATGYKRRGNKLVMSDPVVNRNNIIRKVRDMKGTPAQQPPPPINQPPPPPVHPPLPTP